MKTNPANSTNPEDGLDFLRGESLTGSQLVLMGKLSQELARVIREHLPLQGRVKEAASRRADQWYCKAVELYRRIEEMRNPKRLSYVKNRHCAAQFLGIHPEFDHKDYHELGDVLDYLCEIYNWKALSDGSGTVGTGGTPGERPPTVISEMIDRLEAAGRRLDTTSLPLGVEGGSRCFRMVLQAPRSMPNAAEEKSIAVDKAEVLPVESVSEDPAVDLEDLRILRAMLKRKPHLLTQDEICAESNVSRHTISARIKHLLRDGLAHQPKGPKSWTMITKAGQHILAQVDAPKLAQ
jgi:hypothetical protein